MIIYVIIMPAIKITQLDDDENRILYTLKGKLEYIAKIIEMPLITNEEEAETRLKKNLNRQYGNIQEIIVYEHLKKEPNVVKHVFSQKKITFTYIIFNIEDEFIYIDFRHWVKEYNLNGPYSIVITIKYPGFITLRDHIKDKKSKQIFQYYFIKIMKEVQILNNKYNFVHGDLLDQNILVHKDGRIKLFDFDLSSISNNFSINQIFYINYNVIYPLSGKLGFLFDFARLYICLLFFYDFKCIFDNKYKIINDLTILGNIYDDLYIDSSNNVKYLYEWIKWNDGVDNLYINVINFLKLFSV